MAIKFDYNRGITKEVIVASSGDPLAALAKVGDPVVVGGLVGVLMTVPVASPDGTAFYGTVAFQGVLSSVGTEHIPSGAIDQGTAIYTSTAADSDGEAVKATLTTDADDGSADPGGPVEYALFGYTLNTRAAVDGNLEIKVVN